VLAVHRKNVAAAREKGFTPVQKYTKDARLEAASLYYHSLQNRNFMRAAGAVNLVAFLICLFPLAWVIARYVAV
jgi:hypothetical protein